MPLLRHALRSLVRSPIYALSAIITLGLGIGANAIVYSFASAVFIRPLPFARENELVTIATTFRNPNGIVADNGGGEYDYVHFLGRNRTFASVGAMLGATYAVTRGDEVEPVEGFGVSATMWDVLGTKPIAGRVYDRAEDQPLATQAVISERLQQRYFPGPPATAIGKQIVVDQRPRVVIGVMPAAFSPLMQGGDIWTPLGLTEGTLTDHTGTRLHFLAGRLRPGVTVAQATADVARIAKDMEAELPKTHTGHGARAIPLREWLGTSTRSLTLLLSSFVLVLFLLACTNVANLSLARIVQRRVEISTRLALGAEARSLVARQIVEGAILGIGGGLVGILLAIVSLGPLLRLIPDPPAVLTQVQFDWRVGVFVALLAVVTGAVVAIGPALLGVWTALGTMLGSGARRGAGVRERRLQRWLMTTQVTAAALLLVTSIGIVNALRRLNTVDTGLSSHDVVAARIVLPEDRYPTLQSRNLFLGRVLEELRGVPGITSAGVTHNRFLLGRNFQTFVAIEGRDPDPNATSLTVDFRRVTPGYFPTVDLRPIKGRLFELADRDSSPPVMIVNQSFVRRYFPNEEILGHRVRRTGGPHPWATVVGVVPDVMDAGIGVALGPAIYVPYAQNASPLMTFVARSSLPFAQTERALRDAVHSADAALPVRDISTLDQLLSDTLGQQRLKTTILSALAALALVLACTGIYGVTAFLMSDRTKEIAIRMALGAAPKRMLSALIGDASRWIVSGAVVGLALAWTAGRVWHDNLPELRDAGLLTYVGAIAALAAIGVAASWVPSYRASKLPPATVLRE